MNGEESWPISFQPSRSSRRRAGSDGARYRPRESCGWPHWPRESRAEPDLGGIAGFIGTFRGTGLNTIFRPQDFAVTPTPLPNPATGPDDNILEINLTQETLSFPDGPRVDP